MHLNTIGNPSDVTTTMHYLVGSNAKPKILNLKLIDVSHLFENDPSPRKSEGIQKAADRDC